MNMIVGNEKMFGGKKPYDTSLPDLLKKQSIKTPEAIAVRSDDKTLTFYELDRISSLYACDLYSLGVGPDSIVAVLQDRSLELVISLLGILKVGGAYLPLDPSHPSSRLQFVLDDADVSVVLTQSDYVECLGDFLGTVRCVDEPDVWLPREESNGAASTVDVEISPQDLAYVIYTSGSTGQPKGCMLPHQAICNRLQWMQSEYGLGPDDRVLQKTPYTFDVSVWEFFWPLLTGASIVMADPGGHKDNHYLVRTIQSQRVTVCHFVPSMLRFFLNAADVSSCTSLKKIFVSGEALPHELVVQFNETLPHCELHNLYGPTEAAVDVSYWPCSPREDGVVPIGKAITNIDLYLLDASLQPVEDGQEGELFIGGIGLARGYLNRPELTAERFLPNPFSEQADARMYRTGDLAYRLPDGNIAYVGRTDFQVKLRGLRIELGEIESCLRTYPGVTEAAVLVRDETDDPKLVAYLESDTALNSKKVRQHCAQDLPEYMVPNVVAGLSQLPVTPHGKLDRKALPWPLGEREQSPQSSGPISEQAPKETRVDNATDTGKAKSLPSTFSETELTTHVSGYVCEVLRRESLAPDDDLFDLGATSLSLVRVVEKIQQGLGCVVPVDVFLDHPSVAGIVQYLQSQGVGVDASVGVSVDASEEKASTQSEAVANAGTPSSSVRDSLHETVSAIVCDILRRESIEASDDFFDLGATSLSLVRVTEKIQQQLDIVVPVDVFLDAPSVQGVCDYLSQQKNCSHVNQTQEQTPSQEPLPEQEPSLEQKNIHLDAVQFQPAFYQQCIRAEGFDSKSVPCNAFSSWLGLLQLQEREGRGRYLYPSGGGFNPVRTYISVNDNAVEGLAGGSYYYDPQAHQLYRVGDAQVPVEHCHSFDQGAASQAGFALYFVVSLDAIAPIYGEVCRPLAALESGYMVQLLQSRQQVFGLGLRPLVTCDIDAIRQGFALNPSERFVLGLVGGANLESSPVHERKSFAQYLEHQSKPLCISDKPDSIQLRHEGDDPFTKAQQLSKPLLEEFHSAHHQFRRFGSEVTPIALSSADFAWDDYRLRACQREYQDDVVEQGQLTRLLALSQMNAQSQSLYVDVIGTPCVTLYVYVKAGRVQGLQAGVYRYDNDRHELHFCSGIDESRMAMAYTPFNRQHFKRAAFCVYMVQREGLSALSPERAQHLSYVSAGALGQVMMERQAEFSLGLCPIGAVRFDKISDAFGVSSGTSVLQSFTCGVYAQEIPVDRVCLESDPLREVGRLSASLASATTPEDDKLSDRQSRQSSENDIAIVGMSGVYPGADNLDQFWDNLKNGHSAFGMMSQTRHKNYHSTTHQNKIGAYLDNVDQFDNLLFHLSPLEAKALDPQERILLEQVWSCLEASGYSSEVLNQYAKSVGVFIGAMWNDYQSVGVDSNRTEGGVKEFSHHASLANRVSYFYNFNGPSVAVNTSCSSAMTALHFACQSIKSGECGASIVGGVNIVSHDYHRDLLDTLGLLSAKGVCTPLSSEADGWVLGEGVGCLLLRPLKDAERDGDNILGVIKGSAISHSGRVNRYAAPNAKQQKETIRDLLISSDLCPEEIDYIEVAAPGASLADAAEISALKGVFENDKKEILISSIKGNVGHLESASSISQICKVLLQFQKKAWVPSLNNQPLNPLLGIEDSNFQVIGQYSDWKMDEQKKRVLVNVVGAAGSEAHVILEEYPRRITTSNNTNYSPDNVFLVPVSAESEGQLKQLVNNLKNQLERKPENISDVARTMQEGRKALRHKCVFVVGSVESLIGALDEYIQRDGEEYYFEKTENSPQENLNAIRVIAKSWLNGEAVNWLAQGSYQSDSGKRISLPVYPFEKGGYWIDVRVNEMGGKDMEQGKIDNIKLNMSSGHNILTGPTNHKNSSDSKNISNISNTVDILKKEFSIVSEIPALKLNSKRSFEEYGIGSLMIERLNLRLEKRFGKLPKTLWFECRNIESVADYLHREGLVVTEGGESLLDDKNCGVPTPQQAYEEIETLTQSCGGSPTPNKMSMEEDIAIVGVAGRYPGAEDIEVFGDNLENGVDSISEIPSERWDNRRYYSPGEKGKPGKIYSKWGGFLKDIDKFDPLFFKISPRDAELIDPQERLFLQTAWHAVEDAGYSLERLSDACERSVGVFVGVMYGEYQLFPSLENGLGMSGSYGSIANRVSFSLDLNGPSMAIDTMCSSSLTTIHLACESIKRKECRYAIAGGVNLNLHPNKYATHSMMTMSSSDGRCKSFGSGGDGFVASEGVGAIVLKPLSEAIKDGDHVYGVVKATALNHGGRTNGYTVPDPVAHADVIDKALTKAGLDASMVSLIEAHGTGTSLGDPIEIDGLSKVFGGQKRRQKCIISSAKSNIGHCESAAGIAGVTKVLLQMKRQKLFPSLHSKVLNPNIDFERFPFEIQQGLSDWHRPIVTRENGDLYEAPRIAGVSSFGAGGANAHILIQEYPQDIARDGVLDAGHDNEPSLIPLSARNKNDLKRYAVSLKACLEENSFPIERVSRTLQVGRTGQPFRFACVCFSVEDLINKLSAFIEDNTEQPYYLSDNSDVSTSLWQDEDVNYLIRQWIEKKKYDRLAELWVSGIDMEWERFHENTRPVTISLPGYPFEKRRCWVATVTNGKSSPQQMKGYELTPLIHENKSTFNEQIYISNLSQSGLFSDHVVGGTPVLPVAAYFEMVASATHMSLGDESRRTLVFEKVNFHKPLILANQDKQAETKLEVISRTELKFSISELLAGERKVCASGNITLGPHKDKDVINFHDIVSPIQDASSSEPLYRKFREIGIQYGEQYQSINEIRLGEYQGNQCVVASLSNALVERNPGLNLHPFLLDAVFQASLGFAVFENRDISKGSPVSLESFSYYGPLTQNSRVLGVKATQDSPGFNSYDFYVVNDLDELCIKIEGFKVLSENTQELEVSDSIKLSPLSDTLVGEFIRWKPTSKVSDLKQSANSRKLKIIANPDSLNDWFSEDVSVQVVNGDLVNAEENNIDSSNQSRIIWLCEDCGTDNARVDNDTALALKELKRLKQFLSRILSESNDGLELIVATKNGFEKHTDGSLSPYSAAIMALVKTLSAENKNHSILGLDLGERDKLTIGMLSDLSLDDYHGVLSISGDYVLTPVIEPCRLEKNELIRKNGVYLIVGGAGKVGSVFSRYLTSEYQANVIWCGRSPLDEKINSTAKKSSLGGVIPDYIQTDGSRYSEIDQLIKQIKEKYGRLDGVFNAAMYSVSGAVSEMSDQDFDASIQSKIDPCRTVLRACEENHVEFLVCFSSIQSFEAIPLAGSYAAGCAYEEAFIKNQASRQMTTKARVVSWGYWDQEELGDTARQWIGKSGYETIHPREADVVCAAVLSSTVMSLRFSNKKHPRDTNVPSLSSVHTPVISGIKSDLSRKSLSNFDCDLFTSFREEFQNYICERLYHSLLAYDRAGRLSSSAQFSFSEWFSSSGITCRLHRWAEYALDLLSESGFLTSHGNQVYQCTERGMSIKNHPGAWWESSKVKYLSLVGIAPQLKLIDRMFENISVILSGSQDATQVLFPNGSMELVESIYKDFPIVDYYNDLVVDRLLRQISNIAKKDPEYRIRILEIGAGTGGTSKKVFESLRGVSNVISEYAYTDISQAFLDHAEKHYRTIAPYLQTRLLNIENNLDDQGVDLGSYDFVLATNVLHATSDMQVTMGQVKRLLCPSGTVLINEITDTNAFLHLTFGLLDGWWLYSDGYLRKSGSPALSSEAWTLLLQGLGYKNVEYSSGDADLYGQKVFSAINVPLDFSSASTSSGSVISSDLVEAPSRTDISSKISPDTHTISFSEAVLQALSETLKIELSDIELSDNFSNLGLDSISGLSFIDRVNAKTGSSLDATNIYDYPKIDQFIEQLGNQDACVVLNDVQRSKSEMYQERLPTSVGNTEHNRESEIAASNDNILPSTISELRDIVVNIVGVDEDDVDDQCAFSDLGIDSISGQRFVGEINSTYSLSLNAQILYEHTNVESLAIYILSQSKDKRVAFSGSNGDGEVLSQHRADDIGLITPKVVFNKDIEKPSCDDSRRALLTSRIEDNAVSKSENIAIIGMSGRFSGAENVDEFWDSLCQGKDLIRKVDRWQLDSNIKCQNGGLLNNIALFDHDFFGIPKDEADFMDPQQRIFLEEAWHALEDASYAGDQMDGAACGVFVGHNVSDYTDLLNEQAPASAMWGNATSVLPARISYFLNLKGPAVTADSACSSTLTSIHLACQSLRLNECEMAMAGGVFIQSTESFYKMSNKAGMVSQDGTSTAFGRNANGFVPGEGVGVFILKPESRAIEDGDHIYGVIRGSAINQDGASNGLTAPNAIAQESLLNKCYSKTNIDPSDVSFIEAHGTSTTLGDAIEFRALSQCFSQGENPCVIGYSKNNIGHCTAASGAASVIKILKSFQDGVIPQNINTGELNDQVKIGGTRFLLPNKNVAWDDLSSNCRIAATSAFGMSGTNAHVILEQAEPSHNLHRTYPAYIFCFSARSSEELREIVGRIVDYGKTREFSLADMSYSLLVGRRHFSNRLALIAKTSEELIEKLSSWLKGCLVEKYYEGVVKAKSEDVEYLYGNLIDNENSPKDYSKYLMKLADKYSHGVNIRGESLFYKGAGRRLPMPTYPFKRIVCWANSEVSVSDAAKINRKERSDNEDDIFRKLLEGKITAEEAAGSISEIKELENTYHHQE
ncbi:MAG: amino acid adenylation domain-containing protein [Agarilytica sp.]